MDLILRDKLEQILRREIKDVQGLVETLGQEYEALRQRDADNLDKVVVLKEQQLETLNALAGERAELLREAGFAADRSGFGAVLDADSSGTLRTLWQSVEEALQQCQQQNQLNGKLLDVSKQQTQELLSLLLGNEAGGRTGLYDESGKTSTSFNRNTSIKV
jgi:flagella synthesis protein FlgN